MLAAALGGAARGGADGRCTCWARPAAISGCWTTTWPTIPTALRPAPGRDRRGAHRSRAGRPVGRACSIRSSTGSAGCCRRRPGPAARPSSPPANGCSNWSATRRPTRLTSGLGGPAGQLASMGLLEGLDQLARGEIDRDTFNRRYGHRGPHEFEISLPRPAEQPDWIDRQLAQRTESGDQLPRPARRAAATARRCLVGAGTPPSLAGQDPAPAAGDLGQDRPRPRARPDRGDPLFLGAAELRRPRRRADRARRRHLLPGRRPRSSGP